MTQPLSDVQAVPSTQTRPLPPLEEPGERIIVPTKRRLKLRDIFGETSVIRVLATRDFKVKYKQSLLGPLWLVFQPLALLVAFVVAFRGLGDVQVVGHPVRRLRAGGPDRLGVLPGVDDDRRGVADHQLRASSATRPCPRPAFPLAAIIASLPSFAVTAAAAVISAAATGHLSPRVVLLPLGLAWLLLLTAGVVGDRRGARGEIPRHASAPCPSCCRSASSSRQSATRSPGCRRSCGRSSSSIR